MIDFNNAGRQEDFYFIEEPVNHQKHDFTFDPGAVVAAIRADIPTSKATSESINPDGRFNRFSTSDKGKDKDGYVKVFPDGLGAIYGCNRTGIKGVYQAWKPTTPQEEADWDEKVKQAREEARQIREREWAECRRISFSIWNKAKSADLNHVYLDRKGIPEAAEIIRQDQHGNILIPVRDHYETLHGLQRIPPNGDKFFLSGTHKKGHFFIIGEVAGANIILFAEGFATAWTIHRATDLVVVVCFDAGNIKPVIESFHKNAPEVKLIICADDDFRRINEKTGKLENIGVIKAEEAAKAVNGLVVIPYFSGERGDNDTDFNDLMKLEGIEAVKNQVEKVVNQKQHQRGKLQFTRLSEMEFKNISWLVKGYVEEGAIILIIGDPENGKSFFAIDLSCRIATGEDFYGNKVKKGVVLYIAGEGKNGLFRRFKAWCIMNGLKPESPAVYISNMPADFTDQNQLQYVCQEADKIEKEAGQIALIVIDTLARNFGAGDENSAKDMGLFMAECDKLKALYGSAVLIVHHTGVADKTRARGSSSLRGAVDAEFKIERYAKDKNIITLTCTKMKDAEHPERLAFTLKSVDLGITDEDDEPVTSAILAPVLFPDDSDGEGRQRKKIGRNQKQALTSLKQLYQKHQQNLEEGDYNPDQAKVKYEDWKDECIKNMGPRRFREVENSLTGSGNISKDGLYVYLKPDLF